MTTEPTTAISRQRRPRGRYPKTQDGATPKREKRIPEYLEADEINAIIRAAPSPKAKLLMLQQWRAGLRVSEALDLEVRDLSLDAASPTLRVRSGKGGKTRLVPVHPELHGALSSALAYGDISQGRLIEAHTTTAWRWVKTAVRRAEELGAIAPGKHISTHTLRHSYARHLLMNGIRSTTCHAGWAALVDSDNTHLPGACAGPVGELGCCAVEAFHRGTK